jgi:hypothetical protein
VEHGSSAVAPEGAVRLLCHRAWENRQSTCKPGSVGPVLAHGRGGHSSGGAVAGALVQPTRVTGLEIGRGCPRVTPIWSCSRWGLPCRPCCQVRGALLPHPFTLTHPRTGGLLSVALSLGSPPAAVSRHRISMEPGLSSPEGAATRSTGVAHMGARWPARQALGAGSWLRVSFE